MAAASAPPVPPDTAARLLAGLAEADARIERAAGGLDARQLQWRPPEGGWGIGDVLEHLCLADEAYLTRLRPLVRSGSDTARASTAGADGWRPTLIGTLLERSLRATRKLPAPGAWRPRVAPRATALAEFLRLEREVAELLRASLALDWRRTRLASPVSRLIRLNLGDAFAALAAHSARHAGQIERLRAHPAFPADA